MFDRSKTYIREVYPNRNTCKRLSKKPTKSNEKPLKFESKIDTKSDSNLCIPKTTQFFFLPKWIPRQYIFRKAARMRKWSQNGSKELQNEAKMEATWEQNTTKLGTQKQQKTIAL